MSSALETLIYTVYNGPVYIEYYNPAQMEFKVFAPKMETTSDVADFAFKQQFEAAGVTLVYIPVSEFKARKRRAYQAKRKG